MKILLVYCPYGSEGPSGENKDPVNECAMLEDRGYELGMLERFSAIDIPQCLPLRPACGVAQKV